MSSSTGPYKSRLLNWVNRQALHWSDRLEKTARQLKVTAEWGTQLLLYPVYLFVQTGRMAGYRLRHARQNPTTKPQPSLLASDQSIQQVLKALQPSQAVQSNQSASIQGVASVIKTQALVLITQSNQVCGLTEHQQHQLRQRISWEIADYWYQRRQLQSVRTAGQLTAKRTSPHVLAPARFFWGAMYWLQGSPVAIALNLFGESTFVRPPDSKNDSPPRQLPPSSILASLERKRLKPVVSRRDVERGQAIADAGEAIETNPAKIHSLIKAAIDYFFGRHSPHSGALPGADASPGQITLGDRLHQFQWLRRFRFNELSFPDPSADPFQITHLIRAAIDYFFGKPGQTLFGTTTSLAGANHQPEQSLSCQPLSNDAWLSWEDLFEAPSQTQQSDLTQPQLPTTKSIRLGTPLAKIKQVLNKQRDSTLSAHDVTKVQSDASQGSAINQKQTALELSPDWIDIHATTMGYIKHPLEKILAWLDRIILWLEELVTNIWRWLLKRMSNE